MHCLDTLQTLGFHCRERKNGTLQILTPFRHIDGEPVYIYLKKDKTLLSDNGNLLFFLIKTGRDITHRIHALNAHANQFSVTLTEDGDFTAQVETEASLSTTFGRYLEFISHFLTLEAEAFTIKNDNNSAIEDVIAILKRRNKDIHIERNPKALGSSTYEYTFDLKVNNTLIDVINPHSNATGAALRKAADILKGTTDATTLFVMDDRQKLEAAQKESSIIATVAQVITFSNLEHGTNPLTLLH